MRKVAIIAAFLIGAAAMLLGSCGMLEPKVEDPYGSGQKFTATQIRMKSDQMAAAKEAEAKAQQDAAESRIRAARAEAQLRASKVRENVAVTEAQAKSALEQIVVETEQAVSQSVADAAAAKARLEQSLTTIETVANNALAEIETKRQQSAAALKFITDNPVVQSFAGQAGVNLSGLSTWLGIGAAGVGAYGITRRGQKQADKSYDEGLAEGLARKRLADEAWDEATAAHQNAALLRILAAMQPPTPTPPVQKDAA
jgi:hypothetical protein